MNQRCVRLRNCRPRKHNCTHQTLTPLSRAERLSKAEWRKRIIIDGLGIGKDFKLSSVPIQEIEAQLI